MKKLAGTLVLALVFAAPLVISNSAAQASSMKSQPHMAKSVKGKHHHLKQHKVVKTTGQKTGQATQHTQK